MNTKHIWQQIHGYTQCMAQHGLVADLMTNYLIIQNKKSCQMSQEDSMTTGAVDGVIKGVHSYD